MNLYKIVVHLYNVVFSKEQSTFYWVPRQGPLPISVLYCRVHDDDDDDDGGGGRKQQWRLLEVGAP